MAQTIEIDVGELHAQLHEQLVGVRGDDYTERVRDLLESHIHEEYQEVEREQEERNDIIQKALGDSSESPEESSDD